LAGLGPSLRWDDGFSHSYHGVDI
jgi:hypothetical protein